MAAKTEVNTIVKFYKLNGCYIEVYYNPKYRIVLKYVETTENEFVKIYLIN